MLSTQGDSSNGTAFGDRKNSAATKVKSSSMSSGSNERNSGKKVVKDSSDKKIQPKLKDPLLKIDSKKQHEFCQRIKMKNENSRNFYHQQNNHHRYKMYSSGEREPEEVPGNYLAKTSEKLKFNKKIEKDSSGKLKTKAASINQAEFKKIIFKSSNKSRGRSNKSGPMSNRGSSCDVPAVGIKMKKNSHQTIKFNKKKIHIVRSTSRNPKNDGSRTKILSSKKSDESGNAKDDVHDENSSNSKKVNKIEIQSNWKANGTNIEKIAALASISKYSNTGNFTSEDFQTQNILRKGEVLILKYFIDTNVRNLNMKKEMNPISPTSTKSLIESDNFATEVKIKSKTSGAVTNSKGNILSLTFKNKEGVISKNSGTIEASSYNSLISHQSKSFSSNTKDKSINSIINTKTIVSKK